MTMIDKMALEIENAIRKSVPWPDKMYSPSDWDIDDDEVPQTLEQFVEGTYIRGSEADEVFKAAAVAAARAALTAMLEPSEAMLKAADTNVWFAQDASDLATLRDMMTDMIQAALDEKEG